MHFSKYRYATEHYVCLENECRRFRHHDLFSIKLRLLAGTYHYHMVETICSFRNEISLRHRSRVLPIEGATSSKRYPFNDFKKKKKKKVKNQHLISL